jgi:anti-sigma regulatory factor (Ser/Thr protein kinase)
MKKDGDPSGEKSQSLVDVRLARDVRAPALARRALEVVRPRVRPNTFHDVRLLVSELVTNSVQHGGPESDSWVCVRLRLLRNAVRVEVTDPGRGFFFEGRPAPREQASGRGLFLVGLLSDRWGVAGEGVTRVWFEIGAAA